MNVKKTKKKFKENRPENYHVHDNGPITFIILSLGPQRQQDYTSAHLLTQRIIIDGLVSGHTFL